MTINYEDLQSMLNKAFSEYMEERAAKHLSSGTYQYVINAMEKDMNECNIENIKGIIRIIYNSSANESVYIVYGRNITTERTVYKHITFVFTGEEANIILVDNIAIDYENINDWLLYKLMCICEFVTDYTAPESLIWAIHMAEEFDPTYMGTICKLEGYQDFNAVYKEIGATLQDSIAKFYEDNEFNMKVKDAYYDVLIKFRRN